MPIQEQIQGPVIPDLDCREDQSWGTVRTTVRAFRGPESGPSKSKNQAGERNQSQVVVRTRFMSQ